MPEIVTESIEIDGVSYKTVCYEKIVPVLVEGARFLNDRRALTEQRLDALEQGLHNVRSMLERMERLMGKAGQS